MTTYNPQEIEKKILELWENEKMIKNSLELRRGNKTFSFMDGPPTANNPMGVHHAWGRTYKDLFLRLKTMQGFDTRKQPGFDCQGLWVEVGVEKELGFKTKKDIEKYGIGKFTEKCVENVLNYVKIWIDLSKKLGMWMDWKDPYLTLSDTNIEYVWYFLKKCHEKGWLYKGMKVLPWCPRCQTSLSSHEVSVGYKELTHTSLYLKFPIKNRENEYLLVWTTTPWTIPADVAVAVHPDMTYVKVKQGNEYYILSKTLVEKLDGKYKIIKEMSGKDLVELEYIMPYNDLLIQSDVKHWVILWDLVSDKEGTGMVHVAPGTGPEDFDLGKEYSLPIICPIDEESIFNKESGWLAGKTVKEANPLIIEDLQKRGFLYKTEKYTHSYPCCWRCNEELVFKTSEEWFISTEKIKPKLIKEAKKVKWYPEWTQKSMIEWLTNLKDWNISRKRYYGLPLPFWTCDCGYIEVIGTKKELKKKAIKGYKELKELHRPWIDNVILKCSKCKGEMKRVPETGDCWLDAGVVFFSTLNYFDNKKFWKKWFPADFITEMHEQVRLWFYATLFVSVTLEGKTPYKSALAHGMVLDEKFKEMHKSTGNVIWADEAIEKMGADVMRWMYCKQNPGQAMPFGYTPAKEVRRILNILFNTVKFLQTYCEVNNFKPKKPNKLDISSKWLLSRIQTLKKEVTKDLDELKPHLAANKLEEFFLNDLSRWYGHIIREDIKPGIKSKSKQSMLYTFYVVSLESLKLLSPFIPFVVEDLYQDFFKVFEKEESIHFCDWPKVEKKLINKKLEAGMDLVKKIVETSNAIRHEKGIKLKYPLKGLTVKSKKKVKTLENIIKKMANVKEVNFEKSEKELEVVLDTKITQELKDGWLLSELTRNIQAFRKKLGLKIKDKVTLYLPEEQLFKKSKEVIEGITGSKIVFGKIEGNKSGFKFENKKYEFGIKV